MTKAKDVPAALLRQPFRIRDARALGVSTQTLRGSRFATPFPGVRVPATLGGTLQTRAAAALLAVGPGAVLSCHTAAQLRGLPVPASARVHVDLVGSPHRRRVEGIEAHVRAAPAVPVGGLPVVAARVMFAELAQHIALVDLVVVGDALVRHGWLSLDALRQAVAACRGRRGARLARRAVELVRERVDSPQESRVRLLVVLAGLPCPEPGYRVIADGHVIGWVDLAYPAYRIAIEYDGDLHRTMKKKWRLDVATREALHDLGWTVIVLTWDDYAVTPARTVGRVARALAQRGCADVPIGWANGAVDPASLRPEWRAAFPGSARHAWNWEDRSA